MPVRLICNCIYLHGIFIDAAITITNGTFAWDTEDERPAVSEYVNLLIVLVIGC